MIPRDLPTYGLIQFRADESATFSIGEDEDIDFAESDFSVAS